VEPVAAVDERRVGNKPSARSRGSASDDGWSSSLAIVSSPADRSSSQPTFDQTFPAHPA